jgi:hypothetical protein
MDLQKRPTTTGSELLESSLHLSYSLSSVFLTCYSLSYLRGFFESASSTLLRPVGQVCIVLLKGQCERWETHELAFCAGLQIRGIAGQSFNWNNIRNGECQYTPRDRFGERWVPPGESLTYVYEKSAYKYNNSKDDPLPPGVQCRCGHC